MRRAAALLTTLTLALAGCGGGGDGPAGEGPELPPEATATAEPAEPTTEGPQLNERGNIVKALGEEGGFTGPDGERLLSFAVDAIQPAECTAEWREYGSPSQNGHLMEVRLRVSTAPELAQDQALSYFTVSSYDFDYIGPDGVTVSAVDSPATYGCLPQNAMFTQNPLGPGQQFVGSIVVDVPAPSGTLIYRPAVASNGWEWQF